MMFSEEDRANNCDKCPADVSNDKDLTEPKTARKKSLALKV